MLDQTNPLDPTGLTCIDGKPLLYGRSQVSFTMTGFRDKEHAKRWADAYYDRYWGYGPSTRVDEIDGEYSVHVVRSTSCD